MELFILMSTLTSFPFLHGVNHVSPKNFWLLSAINESQQSM